MWCLTKEETGEEDNYICRFQSWWSENFNRPIDALDAQCKATNSMGKRSLTTSSQRSTAKRWMISAHANQDEEEGQWSIYITNKH